MLTALADINNTQTIIFVDNNTHTQMVKFWTDLGDKFFQEGSYDKAITHYDKAIIIDPTSASAWSNKAECLFALRKFDEAESSINNALNLYPNFAQLWYVKSLVLYGSGKLNESLESINKSIEINSSNAPSFVMKGVILSELYRYNESLYCFNKATEVDPSYAPAWVFVGLMLDISRKYDEALKYYDKAIELDPVYAPAWFYKGNLLAMLKKYNESKECWNQAIIINPKYKVLEREMKMFPNSTLRLTIQQSTDQILIYVDPETKDILENMKFIIEEGTESPFYCDVTCNVTGKTEVRYCGINRDQNGNPLPLPTSPLYPGQTAPLTGRDMFEDIKKIMIDSGKVQGTVVDITSVILYHNCIPVCEATGCTPTQNGEWTCSSCTGTNTDIAVWVNNDVIVGLMVRPNSWMFPTGVTEIKAPWS